MPTLDHAGGSGFGGAGGAGGQAEAPGAGAPGGVSSRPTTYRTRSIRLGFSGGGIGSGGGAGGGSVPIRSPCHSRYVPQEPQNSARASLAFPHPVQTIITPPPPRRPGHAPVPR